MQPETITLSRYKIWTEANSIIVTGIGEDIEERAIAGGFNYQWLDDTTYYVHVVCNGPVPIKPKQPPRQLTETEKASALEKWYASMEKHGIKRHSPEETAQPKRSYDRNKPKLDQSIRGSDEWKSRVSSSLKDRNFSEAHKRAISEAKRKKG